MRSHIKNIVSRQTKVALVLLLVFSVFAPLARTQSTYAFGGSGSGTGGDPYLVSNCTQFSEVNNAVNAAYKLTQNIDCASDGNDILILNTFTGTFDGQGHTINYALTGAGNDIGLFGVIDEAIVQNLTLTGTLTPDSGSGSNVGALAGVIQDYATISNINVAVDLNGSPSNNVGGIAGSFNSSSANDIVFSGAVTNSGNGPTGGFFGTLYCSATVNDSHSSGAVSANGGYTGGISGGDECEGVGGTYTNVYNTGTVTNDGSYVGGIVGRGWTTSFEQVHNTGRVEGIANVGGIAGLLDYGSSVYQSYNTGEVFGYGNSVGGVVGYLAGSSEIIQSFSTGEVTTQGNYAGGILGYLDSGSSINNSYARGDVHGNAVGGLVGRAWSGSISTSYATGAVDGQNEDHGGVVAITDISGDNGLFWNIDTSVSTSVMGHGKTTAEMKDIATYTDTATEGLGLSVWDFTGTPNNDTETNDYWSIYSNANDGYPCLNWDETCSATPSSPDSDGDGIADDVEDAGPNNGDANHDGTADKEQDNIVAILNEATGKYGVLELSESCEIQTAEFGPVSALPTADSAYTYQHGMFDFTADCGGSGSDITVKQYYYDADMASFVMRKYNSNTHQYGTIDGATVTQTTIDGHNVVVAEYQVKDGGPLDLDGAADGHIHDPAGIGIIIPTSSSSSNPEALAGTGQSATFYIAIAGMFILCGFVGAVKSKKVLAK